MAVFKDDYLLFQNNVCSVLNCSLLGNSIYCTMKALGTHMSRLICMPKHFVAVRGDVHMQDVPCKTSN